MQAPAGAYAQLPAWRSREHYMTVVLPAALAARPDATAIHDRGHRRRVAVDTFTRVLWVHALAADDATGRGIRITTAQAATVAGCSERTVQHCRAIARELGLLADVVHGRQLTLDERLTAYEQGSKQRGLANESCLTLPRWLLGYLPAHEPMFHRSRSRPPRPKKAARTNDYGVGEHRHTHRQGSGKTARDGDECASVDNRAGENLSVECCTPPCRTPDTNSTSVGCQPPTITPQTAKTAPPAPTSGRNTERTARAGMHLARQLVARLPWLRVTTRPGRIAPMLARFERASMPWTAADILAAVNAVNARMGWTALTSQHVRTNGHAVLAYYLRHLDVDADHPRLWQAVAEQQRRREQARRRADHARARAQRIDTPADLISTIRDSLRTKPSGEVDHEPNWRRPEGGTER